MNAAPAQYQILFNQRNITADVSDYLLSLSYTDKATGESDEIELTMHDRDGLWQNDWFPSKGDTLTVDIMPAGQRLACGTFGIDEICLESSRSGDVFTMRGIAAPFTKALRTKNSTAHENKTLRELAKTIADKHGFTLQGEIEPIRISRVSQFDTTDLRFLMTIAEDYGYTFSVRGNLLVFTNVFHLEQVAPSTSIDKTDMTSFSFTDKTQATFKKALLKHHHAKKGEQIGKLVTLDQLAHDDHGKLLYEPAADTMVIHQKVDNEGQAEKVAKSKLHKKARLEKYVAIECPGNVLIVSGANVELTGVGRFSGNHHVHESTHTLDRGGGYKTSFSGTKVAEITQQKHYPKKKK